MSNQVPAWYVTQYNKRVIEIYQAKGNRLRPTVSQAGRIEGEKAIFWLAGEGTARKIERNTRAVPMNPDRKKVELPLTTWQAFDTVDEFDADRINVNEKETIASAGAMALGRATDQEIIDVMNAAADTSGDAFIDASGGAFSPVHALQACNVLQDLMEQWDGEVYCGLPSLPWNQFLSYKQVNSSEHVGSDLPYVKRTATRFWNGVNWFLMPKRFFPVPSANKLDLFVWHKSAVGWGNHTDLVTNWDWDNWMTQWTVNMRSKGGATVFQKKGIVRIRVSTNSAITLN